MKGDPFATIQKKNKMVSKINSKTFKVLAHHLEK